MIENKPFSKSCFPGRRFKLKCLIEGREGLFMLPQRGERPSLPNIRLCRCRIKLKYVLIGHQSFLLVARLIQNGSLFIKGFKALWLLLEDLIIGRECLLIA